MTNLNIPKAKEFAASSGGIVTRSLYERLVPTRLVTKTTSQIAF